MTRGRIIAFAAICILCVLGAGLAIARSGDNPTDVQAGTPGSTISMSDLGPGQHAVFVNTRLGPDYGKVAVADASNPDAPFVITGLSCERVDFAGGRGICLQADRGVTTTYKAVVFDETFTPLSTNDLPGIPSRTRVSPDGRWGAWTTFVSGDSYASQSFSTRTHILDLRTGDTVGDLETFSVTKDGQPFSAVDFNFWGVTFAQDPNTFYATLGTGGVNYLVKGDVRSKSITVLRDGVECPSLSPDGTHLAYKKRTTDSLGRVEWRLSVIDLATLADHPTAETRNVDDQAAWLDNSTVLYGVPHADAGTPTKDTYAVPADGSGAPRLVMPGAWSLDVTRP